MSLVFERVVTEGSGSGEIENREVNIEELKLATSVAPKGLKPCAADAYLLFQVIVKSSLVATTFINCSYCNTGLGSIG